MNRLTRYIQEQFLLKTAGVLLILLALRTFLSFGEELRDLGSGSYGVSDALLFVLLMMPRVIYEFFPISILLGALIALGGLAANHELVVMQASGYSRGRILKAIVGGVLLALVGVIAIGEGLAPYTLKLAEQQKALAVSNGRALATGQGVWLRSENDFFYIQEIDHAGELKGVLRYHFDRQFQLKKVSYAETGDYKNDHWLFHHIRESELEPGRVVAHQIKVQSWPMLFSPQLLALSQLSPEEKPLWQLYTQIQVRHQNGLQYNHLAFNFWQRVYQPVASIIMLSVALPFVFGSLKSLSIGFRIVVGSLVGIGFYLLNHFVGPLSMVYQMPPAVAALCPILVMLCITLALWRVSQ